MSLLLLLRSTAQAAVGTVVRFTGAGLGISPGRIDAVARPAGVEMVVSVGSVRAWAAPPTQAMVEDERMLLELDEWVA